MKLRILHFVLTASFSLMAFYSQGQVTINAEDYPRENTFLDLIYISTESFPTVTQIGADQIWDYSNLVLEEIAERNYFDATDDQDLVDAHNWRFADLSFQGFLIESDHFEALDDQGWYDLGRYSFGVNYSITAISGGPTDSLFFPENAEIFDGRINYLQFPVNYEQQWTASRNEKIPFALSIAAFGLDKTPGTRQRTISDEREVVGHGSLILPNADGTPTLPMDVLVIESIKTEIDSVFLGGAPAPAALMAAFGLTQGASVTETTYIFYTPGFGSPVMSIEVGDSKAFYRPYAADGLIAVEDAALSDHSIYPNPVSVGEVLTLVTEKPVGYGSINLVDLTGKKIFNEKVESNEKNEIHLKIPPSIAPGMYMYHVLDESDVFIALGKLQIE